MVDYILTDDYWVDHYWFATYLWWPLSFYAPSTGRTFIVSSEDRDLVIELEDRRLIVNVS